MADLQRVLVLSRTPSRQAQIQNVLASLEVELHAVPDERTFLIALKKWRWTLALADMNGLETTALDLLRVSRRVAREVPLLMILAKDDGAALEEAIAGGAADVLSPTCWEVELRVRTRRALICAHDRERRGALNRRLARFLERALGQLVEVERASLREEVELGLGCTRRVLLVHPAAELGPRIASGLSHLDVEVSQALTGGGALDRGEKAPLDWLVVLKELPDLDGTLVADSISSVYPGARVLELHRWGEAEGAARLRGGGRFSARSPEELIGVLEALFGQEDLGEESSNLVEVFKRKHRDFMREFSELKALLHREEAEES